MYQAINYDITVDDVVELLREDFSGDNGDAPLSYDEIKKIIAIITKHEAKFAIMGVVSGTDGECLVCEHILISIPKYDKVYTLKRFQSAESLY